MDAKTIETLSVGAVKKALSLTHVLDPEIRENDKEQSWDGAVYIYKNTVKKKSNLRGRVPVQVKGTVQKDLSKETVTYPMSVVHLRNYLNDHGVMLFVVYVDDAGNNTIYYTALTPLKLKKLLAEVDESKSRRKNRSHKRRNLCD